MKKCISKVRKPSLYCSSNLFFIKYYIRYYLSTNRKGLTIFILIIITISLSAFLMKPYKANKVKIMADEIGTITMQRS